MTPGSSRSALPELTGAHAVGVSRQVFRSDSGSAKTSIYYPAEPDANASPVAYVWDADVLAPALERFFAKVPARLDISALRRMRAHAVADARPLRRTGGFPVVLFSHGRGAALVQNVTRTEDLASHGYVVAGIEHPGSTFATVLPEGIVRFDEGLSDEERVRRMAEEVRSALDELPRLAGSLGLSIDVGRVGHLGRAFGGAVGVAAALADDRIAATANLGGILVGEPAATARPYLQLNHDAVADLNRDYCARTAGPAYLAHIGGTGSTSFSDTPYLPWLEPPPVRFFGSMDPSRAARIVGEIVAGFFDQHLRNGDPISSVAGRYSEVTLDAWRA